MGIVRCYSDLFIYWRQSGRKLDSNLRYRVVGIDERYHWLDRKTNESLTYKDGSEARFDDLDEAIAAFIKGQLSAECNEVLV